MKLLALTLLLPFMVSTQTYERVETIETRWQPVLEALAFCESTHNPLVINKDDGGSPSYGLLQFKESTFKHFGEKYGLAHSDIMNPEQQKAIAIRMFQEGRFGHWKNCTKKMELLKL